MLTKRRKKREDLGTVSFAMLGVLIILLSIVSIAYISRIERINYENSVEGGRFSDMDIYGEKVFDSVESKLEQIGIQSAFGALEEAETDVSEIFDDRIVGYMDKVKEKRWARGDLRASFEGYDLSLDRKISEVESIGPRMQDGGKYDEVKNDEPGVPGKKNTTFCYEIRGTLNLTVENKGYDLELDKKRDLDLTVDVPTPFIREKLNNFGKSIRGPNSHIARLTNYMLTTVAQFRSLNGFGMRSYDHIGDYGDKPTSELITKDDVELAVNLALILETAYMYRAVDDDMLQAFSENCSNPDIIEEILEEYLTEKKVDVGDIISLYYRYGYDNGTVSAGEAFDLDLTSVISQAINSLVDQFILKYFDKMGIMPIADSIYRGAQNIWDTAKETGKNLISFGTSDEEDSIKPSQVYTVKNWVRSTFLSAGMTSTQFLKSFYTPYNRFDEENVTGYPKLPSSFSSKQSFLLMVRLTSEDHRLYKYTCGHGGVHRRTGETCDESVVKGLDEEGDPVYGRCGAEEHLHGYDHALIKFKVSMDSGRIPFRPVDILEGNDELWQDFFDDSYKDNAENDEEGIRDAIKQVIKKIVDAVMNDNDIREMLRDNQRIKIHPDDKTSFLKDMRKNVNQAISKVIDHYRENPEEIAEIVNMKLHKKGDPKVKDLKDFLSDNYDKLVDRESTISLGAIRSAVLLTNKDSPYLDYEWQEQMIITGDTEHSYDISRNISDIESLYISREEISGFLRDGTLYNSSVFEDIKEDTEPHVEDAYLDVKEREISELDTEEKISSRDGLIVRALDAYQYNVSVINWTGSGSINSRGTRSGSSDVWIESITPDPATVEQDVVSFVGNCSLNYSTLEWKSDVDGHLSNRKQFELPSIFLSPGTHKITFSIVDSDGIRHKDTQNLFINLPPDAVIDEKVPELWVEDKGIEFSHISSDQEGNISTVLWEFGDGTNSSSEDIVHTYETPSRYEVRLTVWDEHGGVDTCTKTILIDDAPKMTRSEPSTGTRWDTDQTLTMEFSEPVDPGSLSYDITPNVGSVEIWEDNRTLKIEPADFYARGTRYNLTISELWDLDNGTNSSISSPISIEWRTKRPGEVLNWHCGNESEMNIESSIILTLSEPGRVTDKNGLLPERWNWSLGWSKNRTHLRLDHDPFPSGTWMNFSLDLSFLRAVSDSSSFVKDGGYILEMNLKTEKKDTPSIIRIVPSDGEDKVELDQDIKIWFDEEMNTSSFSLEVIPTLSNVSIQWNEDNDSVTIKNRGFKPLQKYKVLISCSNIDGDPIMNKNVSLDRSFTFTTVDDSQPWVVSTAPKEDTHHYLTDSPVFIIFSEPMDQESISFTCSPDPGYWEPIWNEDSTVLKLRHDEFLNGEDYTFKLDAARDKSGNPLKNGVEFSFRTSGNGGNIEGNLLQKKVWSFIGGHAGGSLFDLTERMLKKTTSGMITSGKMQNLEYRIPLNVSEGFRYGSEGGSSKKLILDLNIDPDYLKIKDEITISEPDGYHYTSVTDISSRPFRTSWNVSIGDVPIDLEVSERGPYVLKDGKDRILSLNDSFKLGFYVNIEVNSGWKLEGVDYSVDRFELTDVLDFLDNIWNLLKKPISQLIDGLQKLLDIFRYLIDEIREQGTKLVTMLGKMVESVIGEAMNETVDFVLNNLDSLKNFGSYMSLLGINMGIQVYKSGREMIAPNTDEEIVNFVNISLSGDVFGSGFDFDMLVLEDNIIGVGSIGVGKLDIDWQVDPKALSPGRIYESWFQCVGMLPQKGSAICLDLKIPNLDTEVIDKKDYEVSLSDRMVFLKGVTIPIGPVVISKPDLGLVITYTDVKKSGRNIFIGALQNVIRKTINSMRGKSINFGYIVELVRTLVSKFIEELIRIARELIRSISFFFECVINGVTVALNFGIEGGETLIDFMNWIYTSVRKLIQGVIHKKPNCSVGGVPESILNNLMLGVEIGLDRFTTSFSVNIPALAALIRKDIGSWKIEFGLKADEIDLVDGSLYELNLPG